MAQFSKQTRKKYWNLADEVIPGQSVLVPHLEEQVRSTFVDLQVPDDIYTGWFFYCSALRND